MRTPTRSRRAPEPVTFEGTCAQLERILQGPTRQEIVRDAAKSTLFSVALARLRDSLRSDVLTAGTRRISLERSVRHYDRRTRQEGFHALHDWDGKADTVNENSIPVDVLNFLLRHRGTEPTDRRALAILLDYYLLHVLALLSLRAWDEGRADEALDRLDGLLRALQGPDGSGQPFTADAETLILVATCHFELEERGYDTLLERVRTLNRAHRTKIALAHATSLGCHLRFGFEATYVRDSVLMRNDNVADYPWLGFALATLMQEYARLHDEGIHGVERDAVVEGLLNGLSPDAGAFLGAHPPASLSAHGAERSGFQTLFARHRDDLLEAFERFRPSARAYSPLSFFFNFSHNVLKGTVVDALLRSEPWPLTLNDLLTEIPRGGPDPATRVALATTLMGYARASPDRIRGRPTPVIVYDPAAGRRAFAITMRRLKD